MREIIESILEGDEEQFEALVKAISTQKLLVFARPEDAEGLTLNFLNYLLEDDHSIEYIPIFSDAEEVNAFVAEADVPDGYVLYEFEGDLFSEIMDADQYIMVNPVSGGFVFQGSQLVAFSLPANDGC